MKDKDLRKKVDNIEVTILRDISDLRKQLNTFRDDINVIKKILHTMLKK